MSDTSHKHPIKMRTFAADMDAVRKQDGTNQKTAPAVSMEPSTNPQPVPKAMPASFNRPNPERTPEQPSKEKVPSSAPAAKSLKSIKEAPIVISEPTVKQPTANSTNKTIPAFHELQKNVASIQENIISEPVKNTSRKQKKRQKESLKNTPRSNIGYDATIITDTKSDRFQLFPSVITSLKKWFEKLKSRRKEKSTPKYTIPEAERRKGVIQRATSKSGTIFTADSDTLREQIRRRRLQEELADEDPETTWSPYTEAGYALLESPEPVHDTTQNIVLEYKRKPQLIEPNNPTLAIPKAAVAPNEIEEEVEELSDNTTVEPDSEEDTLAEARWAASYEPAQSHIDQTEPPLTVPAYQADSSEDAAFAPPTQPIGHIRPTKLTDTNTLTITLLVGIIGVIAIFFTARVFFTHIANQADQETSPIIVKSEPIIAAANITGLPITVQTLQHIPALLDTAVASSSGSLTEFAVVSGIGDVVSPSYLFEVLRFDTKANLRQSLTAAHFISINQSKPGLVLSFVDEDAVRGGLLQWEPSMYNNFSVFYGNTATQNTSFTDQKIAGIDVRVLTDATGEEKLVYGFLSDNTVLITATTEDFSSIYSKSRE